MLEAVNASDETTPGQRLVWLDVARGVGIVLVAYGHVMRGLMSAGLADDPWVRYEDYLLYLFHMPLFFFLAGLTAEGSLKKGKSRFLSDKLRTVAYPYFLWSLIQGSIMLAAGGAVNNPIGPADLAAIPWSPMWQFWFLWSLFACHMAFLIFARGWLALAVAGSVSLTIGLVLPDPESIVTKTFYQFGFYTAGVALSPYVLALTSRPQALLVWLTWGAFAVAALVAMNVTAAPLTFVGLPATCLGLVGALTLARRITGAGSGAERVLASLGRMSMTILVLHILAGSGVRIILVKLGVTEPLALHIALGMAAAIGLPVVAHQILERLNLLTLLGLANPKRPAQAAIA
jgi:fucose 4-O-acetylase-like acetyltransferase